MCIYLSGREFSVGWTRSRSIWRAGGVRALYRGYKRAVLRAFPANGAAMLGIERVNCLFRRQQSCI
eukprot:COSAG04_NODE_30599_length_261_cov_1.574074_1_plen_65_part_01